MNRLFVAGIVACIAGSAHAQIWRKYPADNVVFSMLSGLAHGYAQHGSDQKAKALYSFILLSDRAPADPATYFPVAQEYVRLYEDTNAPDSALQLWNFLTSLHPIPEHNTITAYAKWHLTGIRLNRKLGHYTAAQQKLRNLKKLIQRHHSPVSSITAQVDLLIEESALYRDVEQPAAAKTSLRNARQLIRKHSFGASYAHENRVKLAIIYEMEKKYKKALRCNQKLADHLNPPTSHSLTSLRTKQKIADLYLVTGKHARAVQEYEDLLFSYGRFIPERDPGFISALNNLAEAYAGMHQYHSAYVYLRWACEVMDVKTLEPDLAAKVFTNLSTVYRWKGDHPAAKAYSDQAASLLRQQ